MYSPLIAAAKYIQYYLQANNGKGHGVHSPFVYSFIKEVLNDKRNFYAFTKIESIRKQLQQNKTLIEVTDFGAGSKTGLTKYRTIQQITNSSLKPKKYAQLLFKMVHYYQPKTILELGTSLGITTAYLASANENARVITMEGAPNIAAIAQQNFTQLNLKNIQIITGNFNETLAKTLNTIDTVDFAFLDGNHQYQPTLNYFTMLLPKLQGNSIVVLDDIHWSKEMEQAWYEIKEHNAVTLSIDLHFIGILFFSNQFIKKQHFNIRY
jgi:predicted O-methyltransferase YrrM